MEKWKIFMKNHNGGLPHWQYPKFPTGHYPDRVDFPDWTISRLDNFPTGHFPDWTHSRPDTFPTIIFPTGHYPDWTISRLDIFPTGYIPDWTLSRLDTFPTKLSRLDTFPIRYDLFSNAIEFFLFDGVRKNLIAIEKISMAFEKTGVGILGHVKCAIERKLHSR